MTSDFIEFSLFFSFFFLSQLMLTTEGGWMFLARANQSKSNTLQTFFLRRNVVMMFFNVHRAYLVEIDFWNVKNWARRRRGNKKTVPWRIMIRFTIANIKARMCSTYQNIKLKKKKKMKSRKKIMKFVQKIKHNLSVSV